MARQFEEFRRLGVMVVAVSMSPPDGLAHYLTRHPTAVPMFADPERRLYGALGLARTSWGRLLRPGLVWKYLKLVARGGRVRAVPKGEDALQLGGDFLVAADRELLWSYRGADPTDRPSVADLLRVAETAVDDRRGTG